MPRTPLLCLLLVAAAAAQYDVSSCPPIDSTFELVTGWMYSSPNDILETRTGTLQLAECLTACKTNASCQAVNFETGLCVLFSTQAGDQQDGLIKSQFPVFTMYAQKVCLPSARSCDKAWAFELLRGFSLNSGERKRMVMPNKLACMDACVQEREFACRSASWDRGSGECSMSELDRYSSLTPVTPSHNLEYLESQCVPEPNKMCEFKKVNNKLLKTVDSLHEGVADAEECRQLCLDAPFRCHTYDYEGVCRLSHHSTATVTQVEEPYLTMNGSVSWERGACYNVTLDCRSNHLVALLSTNKVFNGKIYSRPRPKSCIFDVDNQLNFEMRMDYTDPNCGVRQEEPGRFSADLVLQHHDQIMTSADLGFALRCSFHLEDRSVHHDVQLQVSGQIQSMASESTVVPAPNVTMRITDRVGGDIRSAQVGDPLSLRFEIVDINSPYEIFVRELIAMDGSDGAEIVLIDSRGCPTDPSIMGPVGQVHGGGKALQAPFEAFKFPTSEVVQFQALITPCLPTCQEVDCSLPADPSSGGLLNAKSYGRRRKRSWPSVLNPKGKAEAEDFLVMNRIRIEDRIKFEDENEGGETEVGHEEAQVPAVLTSVSSSSTCLNKGSVLVYGLLLLVIQVAVLVVWLFLWRRRRNVSKHEEVQVASPHYFFSGPGAPQQFQRKFLREVSSESNLPRLY